MNALEGVEGGLADLAWVGTIFEPEKLPLHNVHFYAPFAVSGVHQLTEIGNDLHDQIPAMDQQWAKYNQVHLGAMADGSYHLITKELFGYQMIRPVCHGTEMHLIIFRPLLVHGRNLIVQIIADFGQLVHTADSEWRVKMHIVKRQLLRFKNGPNPGKVSKTTLNTFKSVHR